MKEECKKGKKLDFHVLSFDQNLDFHALSFDQNFDFHALSFDQNFDFDALSFDQNDSRFFLCILLSLHLDRPTLRSFLFLHLLTHLI